MHYEIWLDTGENVWAELINRVETEEEAAAAYANACFEYGDDKVEVVQVDDNGLVYPVSFLV